jgi:hypothetical protein
MDYDKILASTPVNTTAARQLSKGDHFEPNIKDDGSRDYFKEILPMRPFVQKGDGRVDYTGHAWGRMRVIGLAVKKGSDKKPRWMCRCVCGNYALRKEKTIKAGTGDMCGECGYTASLRGELLRGMKNHPNNAGGEG